MFIGIKIMIYGNLKHIWKKNRRRGLELTRSFSFSPLAVVAILAICNAFDRTLIDVTPNKNDLNTCAIFCK